MFPSPIFSSPIFSSPVSPSPYIVSRRVAHVALVLAFAASAALAGASRAKAQAPAGPVHLTPVHVEATWRDRFDQIVETFMGDPSAGVDIDMKHVLDAWRASGPKPFETLTIAEARAQPTPVDAAQQLMKQQSRTIDPFDITVKDVTYPGPGGSMSAQIFSPAAPSAGPRPVVVFYHGGGFVMDNKTGTGLTARAIAGTTGAMVIVPSYRLAPESKFPAAQDDSIAAYQWVLANVAGLGGDPAKIAMAGEGAGGLLAADTCMAARDAHLAMPVALILITPVAGIDLKTASYLQDAAARPWSQKAVVWALGLFLSSPDQKTDPRIDLVGHADVAGLPPTTIVTAEIDPLRSDGERLGGKLKLATVPAYMRDYDGVTHDFFGMGQAVEKAVLAQQFVAKKLGDAFAGKTKVAGVE